MIADTVFGLGPLGLDIARHFVQLDVKAVSLCDPFPIGRDDLTGQDAARLALGIESATTIRIPYHCLTEDVVREVACSHGFLVSCFGPGFPAVDHWVNRAAHAARTPALFCSVGAGRCILGPLVFPFETACYICWQMRSIACADRFSVHMAFAEQTASWTLPQFPPPPEPSYLAGILAGMAVNEMLKASIAIGRLRLTDAILEFEPFNNGWGEHPVLRRPDCPVCSKKTADTGTAGAGRAICNAGSTTP